MIITTTFAHSVAFDLLTPKYCINTSIVSVKIFSPLEKLRSVRSKCKATPWLLYVTAINVFHNVDACVSNCSCKIKNKF